VLKKRIIPCLDVKDGRVVKGINFVSLRDAGDPAELARLYMERGADELVFLDISASAQRRGTKMEWVAAVARELFIPFTVGGGISDVRSAAAVLAAGASKVSTSSAAFRRPEVIAEMVREFGADRVTVAIDADANSALPSGYEVYIDGGNTATGRDAVEWAKEVDGYGVGCILPTSKSTDGVRTGYDLPLIEKVRAAAREEVDVVASGGAGTMEHFAEAATAGANVLLAASVFHFHIIDIPALKSFLKDKGFSVRG